MANYRGLPATACGHCGEVVLRGASRCKNCFESLQEKKSGSIWGLVLLNVIMIGTLGLGFQLAFASKPMVNVITDMESKSIIVVRKFGEDHYEADRIPFNDIVRIESLATDTFLSGPQYSISVIDKEGTRHVLNESGGSLLGPAQAIAEATGRPLEQVDRMRRSDLLGSSNDNN